MFWQSVEELEAEKQMRRIESLTPNERKDEQMFRRGMDALRNIEEATRKKYGKDVVDKNKGMIDKVTAKKTRKKKGTIPIGKELWQKAQDGEKNRIYMSMGKELREKAHKHEKEERMRRQGQEALYNIELSKMYSNKTESTCGRACMHGCVNV